MRFDIKQISMVSCTTLAAACSGTPRITEPALGNAAVPAAAAAPANNVDASLVA
jgi:hypothetical protein